MENKQENGLKLPCPAELLIPHREPMCLIDHLVKRSDDRTLAATTVLMDKELLFIDQEHGITAEFFIEIIAQTAAAANGYDTLVDGKEPGAGFIVKLDDFSLFPHSLSARPLLAETEKIFEFNDMTRLEGRLYCDDKLLASGTIQVWEESPE